MTPEEREARAEPIWIPCEGSGCPGHRVGWGIIKCSMCGGERMAANNSDTMPTHQRKDVVAMLARGDFDD